MLWLETELEEFCLSHNEYLHSYKISLVWLLSYCQSEGGEEHEQNSIIAPLLYIDDARCHAHN